MQRSGMLRILLQNSLRHRRRFHVRPKVPSAVAGSDQREGIESRGFLIIGIILMQTAHGGGVLEVPLFLRAVPIENLDSVQVRALSIGRRLHGQPLQSRAAGVTVLCEPDRLVVRHRFAPIGHRKRRCHFLSSEKLLSGLSVFEAVEEEDAAIEVLPGFCRP